MESTRFWMRAFFLLTVANIFCIFLKPGLHTGCKDCKLYFTCAFSEPSVRGGGGMRVPHHNFLVVTPMIMKFGTGIKLDVFYTIVAKSL